MFPGGIYFGWKDTGRFCVTQYLLMHSVFYLTALLKACNLILPKHTYYVDNLFVYCPLPRVKSLYYLNVDFYQYAIGRPDQSVNEKVMVSKVDQQIRITKMLFDAHDLSTLRKTNRKLARYMTSLLSMMICISSILLIIDGTIESKAKKEELWAYVKEVDLPLYYKLRYFSLASLTVLFGRLGEKFSLKLYRLAKKIYRFN